jgi:hypothetical protein
MMPVIWLLIVQGALGAFDTLWYHEWKVALHSRPGARRELALHALRNFCYAALYGMLAWREWHGPVAAVLFVLLAAELTITLTDFLEEDRTRKLPGGERIMHALVGVAWGAMLVYLLPLLWSCAAAARRAGPGRLRALLLGALADGGRRRRVRPARRLLRLQAVG